MGIHLHCLLIYVNRGTLFDGSAVEKINSVPTSDGGGGLAPASRSASIQFDFRAEL